MDAKIGVAIDPEKRKSMNNRFHLPKSAHR